MILPMLSKLECARKTLRVNSQIDILLGEENKELKACVDAMSNLQLSQFAIQQEIDDARQNYTDTLIDQAIDRMATDNEKAAQQREDQIAVMEEQLRNYQESGKKNQFLL